MVDSGRKTVELLGVISKKSDIGTAMVVTLALMLIVIISYSLGSQKKSILKVNFEKDGTCKTCWAARKNIHAFRIKASRTLFFS